jgi:hypothetical protein
MEAMRRFGGWAALSMAVALLPAGCVVGVLDLDEDDDFGREEVARVFHQVVPVDAQGILRVAGQNGTIHVEGAVGGGEVVVSGTRRVRAKSFRDAEEHLDLLQVVVHPHPSEVLVETHQPERPGGREYTVDYEITVPENWCVVVTNGNGSVRVEDLVGDVEVQNGNGDAVLAGVVGSSWLSLGNGSVDADVWLPNNGEIVHSVGNGSVRLRVQPDVSAQLEALVGNGSITLSGLTLLESTSAPGSLKGLLGGGEGTIHLSVGNGWIEMRGG